MKKRAFDVHSNAAMEFVVEEFVFGGGNMFLFVDGPTMWCAAIINVYWNPWSGAVWVTYHTLIYTAKASLNIMSLHWTS